MEASVLTRRVIIPFLCVSLHPVSIHPPAPSGLSRATTEGGLQTNTAKCGGPTCVDGEASDEA